MKASYYLRAQNFAAPSVNDNHVTKRSNWYGNDDDDSSRNGLVCTNNIMFDNRVCRGNTYATPVFTEDQRRHQEVYKRTQQARRSMIEKRRKDVSLCLLLFFAFYSLHIILDQDRILLHLFFFFLNTRKQKDQ